MKFMSKVIEKAASCQVTTHVDDNNLGEIHQSSYKRFHSTESALLKVKNDILQYVDHGKVVLVVLLDMSAAFDTVEHSILLNRLESHFGIKGSVLSWYESYFEKRSVRVTIKNTVSDEHTLTYSLPQGSIIGPQGFIMYTIATLMIPNFMQSLILKSAVIVSAPLIICRRAFLILALG